MELELPQLLAPDLLSNKQVNLTWSSITLGGTNCLPGMSAYTPAGLSPTIWEGVVVLKELIFKFLIWEGMVVMKELIISNFYFGWVWWSSKNWFLTSSTLGRCGGLERPDL